MDCRPFRNNPNGKVVGSPAAQRGQENPLKVHDHPPGFPVFREERSSLLAIGRVIACKQSWCQGDVYAGATMNAVDLGSATRFNSRIAPISRSGAFQTLLPL
jgi:hypothetical protein